VADSVVPLNRAALIKLAGSAEVSDRLRAGPELARLAGDASVDRALGDLLLDPDNEAIIQWTAQALADRHDTIGLVLLFDAYVLADIREDLDASQVLYEALIIYVRAGGQPVRALADLVKIGSQGDPTRQHALRGLIDIL
jgi:hypothetical protein